MRYQIRQSDSHSALELDDIWLCLNGGDIQMYVGMAGCWYDISQWTPYSVFVAYGGI